MSCDDRPDTACQQILDRVYFFIDNELAEADAEQIRHHIHECAPCLDEVALERLVKTLIARSCVEQAPRELRQRVVFSIRQVQLEVSQTRQDLD